MTKIEWCRGEDGSEGVSWNALRAVLWDEGTGKRRSANHCEHVNEACRFCYAEKLNARLGGLPFKPGHRHRYTFEVDQKKLLMPLRRRKPTRIFVESMSDLFGAWWPDEMVDQVYAVMAITPQHTYIDLSKRPDRRRDYLASLQTRVRVAKVMTEICSERSLPGGIKMFPLPNVIEGTSVSCQAEADEFLPILLATRAARHVVSVEPMLGPVDLTPWLYSVGVPGTCYDINHEWWHPPGSCRHCRPALSWVICGGESGPQARPMHPEWPRALRDQCAAAGVAYFYKQVGEWIEMDANGGLPAPPTKHALVLLDGSAEPDGDVRDYPGSAMMWRVGKRAAGRLLDGVEHNGWPA